MPYFIQLQKTSALIIESMFSLYLTKHHAMKTYGESGGTVLLIWALDGSEWSASSPGRFTPEGNRRQCPLYSRQGRPQSWSWRCGGNRTPVPEPV